MQEHHDRAAWLVDLDGTLYRPKPVKIAMGLELVLFGSAHLPAIRSFRHQHEHLRETQTDPVDSPFELQLQLAADDAGVGTGVLRAVVTEWMVERPCKWLRRFPRRDVLDDVRRFRDAGGKTALVSDYPASRKLEALGATELFDVVVSNGEDGGPPRLKPWPDGYLAAAERLGVDASACLVIGDRDDADGEAARRAGMAFRKV